MAVLWAGTGLRVMLHRKNRLADEPQPLVAAVEQRGVSRLDPVRQAVGIDNKAVVLAGNLDLAGQLVLDRVIGAAMAALHLARPPAERQRQHLVAEADAADRF